MSKPTTRIVAAVVDTRNLKLYTEQGETILIEQGDPRLRKILEVATPQLVKQGYADVVIEEGENSYAEFEQQGSGAVRFFRIAKDKLSKFFSDKTAQVPDTSPVMEMSIGKVPTPAQLVFQKAYEAVVEKDKPDLVVVKPVTTAIPDHLIASAAEAIEHFGEDELERFRDQQEAAETNQASNAEHGDQAAAELSQELETLEAEAEQVAELNKVEADADTARAMAAVNEILAHATPVSSAEFHERGIAKQGNIRDTNGQTDRQRDDAEKDNAPSTIIAVVDGTTIIPGMERIKTQFGRAAKMGSTQGAENFLRRLGTVIEQRSHSVEDLLKFMERADTPIADDGSIIIYKVLKRKGDRTNAQYVDCHTQQVEQWTGAYVCMDPSLVDHVRSNECSNGLHVARRGYLREFSGDVCVLAKLAPEDVITVPSYDANKMRVCGYHILAELSDKQYSLVRNNKPLTDDEEGKRLLAAVIAGKHVRRTHEVRIGGHQGTNVTVKELSEQEAPKPVKTADAPKEVVALEDPQKEAEDKPVDPKAVVKQVEAVSRKDQAAKLYLEWKATFGTDFHDSTADRLRQFKRESKVSWEKLGITDPAFTGVDKKGLPTPSKTPPMPKVKAPAKKPSPLKGKKVPAKVDFSRTEVPVIPSPFKEKTVNIETADTPASNSTPASQPAKFPTLEEITVSTESARVRIQQLRAIGLASTGVPEAIYKIKQQSKKSWSTLGVSEAEAVDIMQRAGVTK